MISYRYPKGQHVSRCASYTKHVSAWPLAAQPPELPSSSWTALFGLAGAAPLYTRTGPDNETSTRDTVRIMSAVARDGVEGAGSAALRQAAREVRSLLPGSPSPSLLIGAAFAWVRSHVRFVRDESLLERLFGDVGDRDLLITPARLLSMPEPQGDCDCMSMLTAALLLRLGIPCGFITVAADPERPWAWSHVYVGAVAEEGLVALDTSHGTHAGWEHNPVSRKRLWEVMQPCIL